MADSLGKIPFGKFKGQDIEDIETTYLEWVKGEDWFKNRFADLYDNILKELKYRSQFGRPEE